MLAKSIYFTNYYNISDISLILNKIDIELIPDIDDIRFISVVNIYNKNEDYGLEVLDKYGKGGDNITSRFFQAYIYNLAGRYTDSIMSFKNILENCSDQRILKTEQSESGKDLF